MKVSELATTGYFFGQVGGNGGHEGEYMYIYYYVPDLRGHTPQVVVKGGGDPCAPSCVAAPIAPIHRVQNKEKTTCVLGMGCGVSCQRVIQN